MSGDHSDNDDRSNEQGGLSEEVITEVRNKILGRVGYKRPPTRTQFKKGQSGNPTGRPRSLFECGYGNGRSANAFALREGSRSIIARENGDTREMSVIEAVQRAQAAAALRGNAYAQKQLIERYHWAEREERAWRLEEVQLWEDYVEVKRAEIATARPRGETPPSPLPHPDDVVIDYDKGVSFIGPINELQVRGIEQTIKWRDLLLLQDALDECLLGEESGTGMVLALRFDALVPERYRLSHMQIIMQRMRYDVLPLRTLLKKAYQAWREVGSNIKRGTTLPPLRSFKRCMDAVRGGELKNIVEGTVPRGNAR